MTLGTKVKVKEMSYYACADPESFVNSENVFFLLIRGERIQLPLKAGHDRSASETPFKWRFAGGPMIAQHVDWLPSSNLIMHTQKYFLLISQSNDG